MDQPGAGRALFLEELQRRLSPASLRDDTDEEALALCDERLMAEYLESGTLTETNLAAALARRAWFPCFWGAALRQEGIAELLEGLDRLTLAPAYLPDFAARVYKISTDAQGSRLTHLKVTGGALKVRMALPGGEKITQIRLYNGAKYQAVEQEIQRLEHSGTPATDPLNQMLTSHGEPAARHAVKLADLLRRPRISYADLAPFDPTRPELDRLITEQVEIQLKYQGYIARQMRQVEEFRRMESHLLPENLDYDHLDGLRLEAREKLKAIRPLNLGQASRISGVSPADLTALMFWL